MIVVPCTASFESCSGRRFPQSRELLQPSLTSSLRPLAASIPHLTRQHLINPTSDTTPYPQPTPPVAINHGVRTPIPLPQAAMAEQRQHAHSRRLPSRRSRMRPCPTTYKSCTCLLTYDHSSPSLSSSSSTPPATLNPPSTALSSTSPSWIGFRESSLP